MKRVLIIEDHTMFRQALATLVDQQPSLRVVGQAGSLEEGLGEAATGFDVAVVDLSVPGEDGVDVVARLRDVNPRAGVLALSRRRRRERYVRALEAGANEVVGKHLAAAEILRALRTLSENETSFISCDR